MRPAGGVACWRGRGLQGVFVFFIQSNQEVRRAGADWLTDRQQSLSPAPRQKKLENNKNKETPPKKKREQTNKPQKKNWEHGGGEDLRSSDTELPVTAGRSVSVYRRGAA